MELMPGTHQAECSAWERAKKDAPVSYLNNGLVLTLKGMVVRRVVVAPVDVDRDSVEPRKSRHEPDCCIRVRQKMPATEIEPSPEIKPSR